jgi:N-acetylglucosaminyldiphosphoundecaprenol N-acetyl-beta-D-mannosaminyltransferase
MNEKVIINNQKEQGYTAKAAMKLVVEHMKAKTAQAISVITLEDNQDAECILFVKMFLRFLHKNMGRVLLFAEDKDALVELEEYISENHGKIRIVERASMKEHGVSDDNILNRINGAEAECILVSLPTETERDFLEKYRSAFDAKIWFNVGTHLKERKKSSPLHRFKRGVLDFLTKKK